MVEVEVELLELLLVELEVEDEVLVVEVEVVVLELVDVVEVLVDVVVVDVVVIPAGEKEAATEVQGPPVVAVHFIVVEAGGVIGPFVLPRP